MGAVDQEAQVPDGSEGAISQGHHDTLEMVPMEPFSSVMGMSSILDIVWAERLSDVLFISDKKLSVEI